MSSRINCNQTAAEISENGAELTSLIVNGKEWIWGAKTEWQRHAPLLFPFICNTKSKSYTVNGNTYKLGNHGFARDSVFSLKSITSNSVTYILKSNENTLASYPFKFSFEAKYTLFDSKLKVELTATNEDDKTMPFFVGGHPAFLCPFVEDGDNATFDDYEIVYEKAENITQVFDTHTNVITDNSNTVAVTRELFKEDVFMKNKPCSSSVSLVSKLSGKKVTVSYNNSGCIAVWSPYNKNATFVCLEPWASEPVYCCDTEDLNEMPHAIKLEPKDSYTFSFEITIEG